jgi:putative restriction endonuclease
VLENYLRLLTRLRTFRSRKHWTGLTTFQAPHKPFLLLSVIDHIAQGQITGPFITPSQDLVDTFNAYWSAIMPMGSRGNMAMPFPRLQRDGVWELLPNPGYERSITNENFDSIARLREVCAGAEMDPGLFALLGNPETRERVRVILIRTYFDPSVHEKLLVQAQLNQASHEYCKRLLSEPFGEYKAVPPADPKIRDQGFRKAIVALYDHRCAMCGIRMLTPEGHTIVEAAHIVPWKESRDDRPGNGMALCRLCHWSFDKGLLGVGKKYEVLVSSLVRKDSNLPGHILSFSDRQILRPEEERHWPLPDNIGKHRKEIFIR